MFYSLSKIFWLLGAPSNLIALAMIAGAILWFAGRARPGRALLLTGVALYLLCATGPVGPLLTTLLENRFPRPPAEMAAPDGIIVLGGAMDDSMLETRGALVLGPSGTRMTEAVALSRRYPQARMVFTGGSATISGKLLDLSEADAARRLFDAMGVPPDRFVFEDKSRNTWENAIFTKDLVHPKEGERWLLVTSATHMPRSIGIFRQAGFNVTAWPAHFYTSGRAAEIFSLNRQASDGLMLTDLAMREWVGLIAYRVAGKSNAWFPAP